MILYCLTITVTVTCTEVSLDDDKIILITKYIFTHKHSTRSSIFISSSASAEMFNLLYSNKCRGFYNLTLYLILSPSLNLLPMASLIDKHFPEIWETFRLDWKIRVTNLQKLFRRPRFSKRQLRCHTHI